MQPCKHAGVLYIHKLAEGTRLYEASALLGQAISKRSSFLFQQQARRLWYTCLLGEVRGKVVNNIK